LIKKYPKIFFRFYEEIFQIFATAKKFLSEEKSLVGLTPGK